jgi:Fic family protein
LQSSICKKFGIKSYNKKIKASEKAISEMMIYLYKTYDEELTHTYLYKLHAILMRGSRLDSIGKYRKSKEPMLIVSGFAGNQKIHFEAPPSNVLHNEMQRYIKWFNQSKLEQLKPLARAGLAHLYFESIHPFEDGNGRIGRALAEKALAQSLDKPTLIALSTIINAEKKVYYQALNDASRDNEITQWQIYFAQTILKALRYSKSKIEALIAKAKLFARLDGQLNQRQIKVLNKMFEAEPEGFEGGLSAANYKSITGATIATTTRDLADLVNKKALRKEGQLRYSRYYLVKVKS